MVRGGGGVVVDGMDCGKGGVTVIFLEVGIGGQRGGKGCVMKRVACD